MIYVTHDQIEAMTLADRIVLMRDGLIEQQGAPLDLFERPASTFVAGFLGSPRMSFLPGTLTLSGSAAAIRLADALLPVAPDRSLNGAADGPSRAARPAAGASDARARCDACGRARSATTRRSSCCSRPARAAMPPSASPARR